MGDGAGHDRSTGRPRSALVVGGGIVGACTAYWLARSGLDVTLLEERDRVADGTSAANAGWLLSGTAALLPSWPLLREAVAKLVPGESAGFRYFRWRPRALAADIESFGPWSVRALRSCFDRRGVERADVLRRLSEVSVAAAFDVAEYEGIPGLRRCGTLSVQGRAPRAAVEADEDHDGLGEAVAPRRALLRSRAAVEAVEPALAAYPGAIGGAVHCPRNAVGDCQAFACALVRRARRRYGLQVEAGKRVASLHAAGGKVCSVTTADGAAYAADVVVLCAGCGTPALARQLGERVPLYPVLGYSVTAPWRPPRAGAGPSMRALSLGVRLARGELHLTPLASGALRCATVGELAGAGPAVPSAAVVGDLLAHLRREVPGLDLARARVWVGARPVSADGLPVVSRARHYENLYFNAGHGSLGWTLAMGTAALCAGLVCGTRREDPHLSVRRFDSALFSFLYPPCAR